MRHWYAWYSLAIVLALAVAEWRGWSPLARDTARGVSPTVRSNPGAYRPHYSGGGRYPHGK